MNANLAFIPPERFGEVRMLEFPRAVPAWYRKLRGEPKPVPIRMRLILPAPDGAGEPAPASTSPAE
ncbi:MAG: hypothetical protein J6W70_03865 [Lentisphaeria bacterium]|nr:hypothetical protein [Lentisphaeria bacterium]